MEEAARRACLTTRCPVSTLANDQRLFVAFHIPRFLSRRFSAATNTRKSPVKMPIAGGRSTIGDKKVTLLSAL
jgi:hypothetical protein